MRPSSALKQEILNHLQNQLQEKDAKSLVHIKRTKLGWMHLHVVTSLFNNLEIRARESLIDTLLQPLNLTLGNFPFANYELLTPVEDESVLPTRQLIQLPLWSEILMAPEPDNPVQIEEGFGRKPLVVTFYSFKGGVGRTTSLALVSTILASRGRRVVLIDFDLEAPGLSFLLPVVPDSNSLGLLDYLHQRYLTPEINTPTFNECVRQVPLNTRGEIFLVAAGEYDESYIHRLADLDVRLFYQRDDNPIHQLFDDIKKNLEPDVILIDARTGFNEMGAVALFDQADLGVICFAPTNQSFEGLQWVVQAANKQRNYRGIPDLRFLVTPMPPVAQAQQQFWMTRTYEWIASNWDIPPALTVEEICYQVPYNPNISTLVNVGEDLPTGLLDPYTPIADAIFASLPEARTSTLGNSINYRDIAMHELDFRSSTAQEMSAEEIPTIFQKTGDFPKFLNDRTWLVRGAKGTGKSLLFRLFVERPQDAITLAETETFDLRDVLFIAGHSQMGLKGTILTKLELESYETQVGESKWSIFWLNYAILQLCSSIFAKENVFNVTKLPTQDTTLTNLYSNPNPSRATILNWLVHRSQDPQYASQATDELITIDKLLQENKRRVWILYDELDLGFGQDYARRSRSLEALLGWWVEVGPSLRHITPKILLREDIWNDLNFTNKAHFSGRYVQLRWEEEDLWRLVLRQVLRSSRSLTNLLAKDSGVTTDRLNSVSVEQLRKSLYPIWGERMGRGNKAYTHNWVRTRISDSSLQQNRFPRSLIQLLQKAVEIELNTSDRSPYNSILRPRSLIDALPFVSEGRVAEVRNEYPEFVDLLNLLRGERSPITRARLREIWKKQDEELNSLINDMVKAGIMQEYLRQPDAEGPRYSIAELYLYGLEMTRLGQR